MIINEQGIVFGEFENENVFWIERSSLYQKFSNNEIRSVEFILFRDPNELWLIEAKSGAPKPSKQEDFNSFITKIYEKMTHSLSLLISALINRNVDEQAELSHTFRQMNWQVITFKFVLVINWDPAHPDTWLSPLRNALQRKFSEQIPAGLKIWRIQPEYSVIVINQKMAMKYGLIAR